ncbi:MAG: V-type ATP synthase subunit E [Spirochaetaceae bacterium]|nr:V-type ATP synthase subunit E [Spirochaetaceae bacterium]
MDFQLQDLIDQIKKDGVTSAENTASQIIADAEKKAAVIISEAESKASSIVKSATVETERLEKASVDAIRQAGRNLLISFRDGITAELSALVKRETEKVYDASLLKELIPETVKNWAKNTDVGSLSVLLSETNLKNLESAFQSALKAEIAKGLEIKSDDSLTNGFRIGMKDGSAYYDFSADSLAELFSAYLNPKTAAILKESAVSLSAEGK